MIPLARLSDTVLDNIRDAIGGDLATHVSLSQTCRRLREVYRNNDPEAFWQFACFRAGFGRPKRRTFPGDSASGPSWKDIALILVNHALRCEIKSCRGANAYFDRYYKKAARVNVLARPVEKTRMHPLYYYLHFNPVPSAPELVSPHLGGGLPRYPDALSVLITHLPTFPDSRRSQYGPLCLHPNACCAFATSPPAQSVTLYDEYGRAYLTVENSDGCTVLDVNRGLADILPNNMQFFQEALNHYHNIQLTSGLSLMEYADTVRRDRGFLGDHEYPYLDALVSVA